MEHTVFENIVFVMAVIINIVAMLILKKMHNNGKCSGKAIFTGELFVFVIICVIARMMGVE